MAKKIVKIASNKPPYDKEKYNKDRGDEAQSRKETVENLAAQMRKRGIDPDKLRDPGVVKNIGELVLPKEKGKKPFVYIPKTGKKKTFGSLIRQVMSAAHGVLTGKHLDVSKKRPKKEVKGEPGRLQVPIKRKGSGKEDRKS